jgi:diguanylate cyclase (GGDEF)-like protein
MTSSKANRMASKQAPKQKKPQKSRAAARPGLKKRLSGSPTQIWKSRLSWRITLVAFLTILFVQCGIMLVTVKNYRTARLDELVETGRSAMVPMMNDAMVNMFTSPISKQAAQKLLTSTKVNGMAIYSLNSDLLATYGEPLALSLMNKGKDMPHAYLSADGNAYEYIYRPSTLNRPYIIIARLDASGVQPLVNKYIEQNIMIMLLMSAFVTTVLMIALGHWLLEPILFLRDNLMRASENPENPRVNESPFDPNDEIGGAIEIAAGLISQNADNIKRIKSAAEDQIHKLAYYDTLTSLPNRTLFLQTLNEQARKDSSDAPGRFAVVALDLDHFKDVNDSMGHNIGDAILRAVGKRLRASMPETAVVARSGEDEFAVTMPLTATMQAKDIAQKIANVIRSEPFKVFNENFQIRASIGVSTYPDDGNDPDQVLKNADIALNRAKEDGRDTIKEYSEDFDRAVQQRFQMLRDLRDALEKNQLLLFYQPQLDLKSGQVIGAEALIRWFKPDASKEGGVFIPPVEFIPIAEQSGLIVPIGEWVMRTACEAAADWHKAGRKIRIAVNVSGAQFYQSDLVAYTQRVLKETGLEPHYLELEVTESVFMEDITHAVTTLQNLHALGVELAIDDFGTGYSSLAYLRQFPIDRLKIDQSFIRNALNNSDDAAIARTIVRLGHSLNLKVIAEGVETKEHEDFLMAEDCDEVQGYRYSRPVPLDKFNDFVAGYSGNLSTFSGK